MRNEKQEQVGDGDRKFCHRGDSIVAKTGRLVLHHGGIAAARAAAPVLLGHLARSTAMGSKLPEIPTRLHSQDAGIGKWAAALICVKPKREELGSWQRGSKVRRADTRRPTLGMREAVALGSDVMAPTSFKRPRVNPIAHVQARQAKRSLLREIEDESCYESFNSGFGTDGKPLRWDGSSKRARRHRKDSTGAGQGATTKEPIVMQILVPEGVVPGGVVAFEIKDGRKIQVTVPTGVAPGDKLNVIVPAKVK